MVLVLTKENKQELFNTCKNYHSCICFAMRLCCYYNNSLFYLFGCSEATIKATILSGQNTIFGDNCSGCNTTVFS